MISGQVSGLKQMGLEQASTCCSIPEECTLIAHSRFSGCADLNIAWFAPLAHKIGKSQYPGSHGAGASNSFSPGGHTSVTGAFKGPNVILGLYRCNCSLKRGKELGAAAGQRQGGGRDLAAGLVFAACALAGCALHPRGLLTDTVLM